MFEHKPILMRHLYIEKIISTKTYNHPPLSLSCQIFKIQDFRALPYMFIYETHLVQEVEWEGMVDITLETII